MDRLVEAGAIDDARFARRYAEDKRALAAWGSDRIRAALSERGLDHELIEAALDAEPPAEQVARASELLRRRGADVGSEAGRGRALALLVRRGFPAEIAYDAVREREREAA